MYSAEPSWLAKGFSSPYYTDKHRVFQKAVRQFVSDVMYPEAQECEDTGRRISQEVVDKMWYVTSLLFQFLPAISLHEKFLLIYGCHSWSL